MVKNLPRKVLSNGTMHRCVLEVPPLTSKHGTFFKNLRYCVMQDGKTDWQKNVLIAIPSAFGVKCPQKILVPHQTIVKLWKLILQKFLFFLRRNLSYKKTHWTQLKSWWRCKNRVEGSEKENYFFIHDLENKWGFSLLAISPNKDLPFETLFVRKAWRNCAKVRIRKIIQNLFEMVNPPCTYKQNQNNNMIGRNDDFSHIRKYYRVFLLKIWPSEICVFFYQAYIMKIRPCKKLMKIFIHAHFQFDLNNPVLLIHKWYLVGQFENEHW